METVISLEVLKPSTLSCCLVILYLIDRSVIARCSCPTQRKISISRMLARSRACGRVAAGTWWCESNGSTTRRKQNQAGNHLMARYVQMICYRKISPKALGVSKNLYILVLVLFSFIATSRRTRTFQIKCTPGSYSIGHRVGEVIRKVKGL